MDRHSPIFVTAQSTHPTLPYLPAKLPISTITAFSLWRCDSQLFQIFTTDHERRSEVGRDGMVPSSKCQVCHRHVLREPNPVVHDEDLHRSSVRDGRKRIRDGCFIGEFGLNSLKIATGLRETLKWPVLGVVVCGHLGAERWRVGWLRRITKRTSRVDLAAVSLVVPRPIPPLAPVNPCVGQIWIGPRRVLHLLREHVRL